METRPLKIKIENPNLPGEMLLFRDFDMMDRFVESYPGVNIQRLGRLAISLFRGNEDYPDARDNDYFGIGVRGENDEVHWHLFFEHYPQMAYFSGVAFGHERQHDYHQMLKFNDFKTFGEKFGWFPQVVIDDLPSEGEVEAYCEWLLNKRDLEEEWEHLEEEQS